MLADLALDGVALVEGKLRAIRATVARVLIALRLEEIAFWAVLGGMGLMLSAALVAMSGPLGYPVAAVLTGVGAFVVAAMFWAAARLVSRSSGRRKRPSR